MDYGVGSLQRAVSSKIDRSLAAKTIRTSPGRFGNHGWFVLVSRVHRGMDKLFRLARNSGREPQNASIGVGVAVANGPFAGFAFVFDAEVAMAIDEIGGCVTPFF